MKIFLLGTLFILSYQNIWAQSDLAQKILANLKNASEQSIQFRMQAKLLSKNEKGESNQTELLLYVDRKVSGQRSLAKVLAPARSKGQVFLNNASAYWVYYPKLKRSMSLSPLSTLAGDVSIGDILTPPSLQIYNVKILSEDGDEVQVELRKNARNAPYSRVVQFYKGAILSEAEFYGGQDGSILMKRAQYFKPVEFEDNYFYTQVKIINELQKGSFTLIAFSPPKSVKVPAGWFNPNNLQQVL